MIHYTMGAVFTPDFKQVLLIKKTKPEWQAGLLNFPGGKCEFRESMRRCVSREFFEETGLVIGDTDWNYIGKIVSTEYNVQFFTTIYEDVRHGYIRSRTEEEVYWRYVQDLPNLGVIPNLHWLIPYAIETYQPRYSKDMLQFGTFNYEL